MTGYEERSKLYLAAQSSRQQIRLIIDWLDEARFEYQGGYPSQFAIRKDEVIVATINDEDKPELIIMGIEEFLHEYRWTWKDI